MYCGTSVSDELQKYLPFVPVVAAGIFILVSVVSSFLQEDERTRSRGTAKSGESAEVHAQIMKELDPIDSLYFDVSVARHMLEEGNKAKAKEWLGGNAAALELRRSFERGFITGPDRDKLFSELNKVNELIDKGNVVDAMDWIVGLQDRASELAYSAYTEEAKKRGIDPPEYLDHRWEAAREKKVAEWKAKGVEQGLIDKALLWSDNWARGVARRFIKDPAMQEVVAQSIYPEALELSDKYVTAMMV